MKVAGKSVIVTGGASGIGRALAERFAVEGARGVVVADIDAEWAHKVAARIGGVGVGCDVGDPDAIEGLVRTAGTRSGRSASSAQTPGSLTRRPATSASRWTTGGASST